MFFSAGGIPFAFGGGGMPGMGGHGHGHGGGGGGMDEEEKEVNTSALYEALGVDKSASQGEIKKAYMTLAKKEHPDKGGDEAKFKQISKAYEILGDPEKRANYDRFGEEGAEGGESACFVLVGGAETRQLIIFLLATLCPAGGGGGAHSAEEMFSMLFGGGGPRRGPQGPRKTEDTIHPLKVSLEDLYVGKAVKAVVPRSIYERDPTGPIGDRAGNRYSKKVEREVLDVFVERGMKAGQRITFPGKGDQMAGATPGDVVLVIEQLPHETFQRRGSDLIMKKEVTLLEALTGVRFVVTSLDGHKVLVTSKPGDVVAPDAVKQIADEGMPVYGHPHVFGVMFIQFEVKFPERLELTDAMKRVLGGILPGSEDVPKADAGVKQVVIEEVRASGARGGGGKREGPRRLRVVDG